MASSFTKDCQILAIQKFPSPLHNVPMGQLPAPVAQHFLAVASKRNLVAGELLYDVGSTPIAMYGVCEGLLHVSVVSASGQEFQHGVVQAGQWFGEVPMMDQGPCVFRASAATAASVAVVAAADFWRVVQTHPSAMQAIIQLVCQRYRLALSWIEGATTQPLAVRLAQRLLSLHLTVPQADGVLRLSQEMLAGQLGYSRQSINKLLKLWEQQNLIELVYGGVRIINTDDLQEIAVGN
jgi:CRP/FNR family cyclic AMP-dependent transcriptional regulator